ncbi:MAG: metallophosphoesterase family protein [Actinomycetota bacterium]
MSLSTLPVRLAQISDIHCGEITFDRKLMQSIVDRLNTMELDLVVVAGDLTAAGYEWEFEEAAGWLQQIEHPMVVIPGNHDSRNVGYVHFERLFGSRFSIFRREFDEVRAERMQASGFTVVAVDSSSPDMNEGHCGRENYAWLREGFDHPDDLKILAIHHHLVSIPGTGRERNIITDAGDLLGEITKLDVDVVLSGHKHVPFFWGLNGMLICNSGTAGTRRVRGVAPPSWNELHTDASTIKVFIHYLDGRRELSVIFSRRTRALTREAFFVTDDYRAANQILSF